MMEWLQKVWSDGVPITQSVIAGLLLIFITFCVPKSRRFVASVFRYVAARIRGILRINDQPLLTLADAPTEINDVAFQAGEWLLHKIRFDEYTTVYRTRLDGSQRTHLTELDGEIWFFGIAEDYVFLHRLGGEGIWRLDILSGEVIALSSDEAREPQIANGMIYYLNVCDSWKPYQMDLSGGDRRPLFNKNVSKIVIDDGWAYFSVLFCGIFRTNIRNHDDHEEVTTDWPWDFCVRDGYVYYINLYDRNGALYKIAVNGRRSTRVGLSKAGSYRFCAYEPEGNQIAFGYAIRGKHFHYDPATGQTNEPDYLT